MYKSLFIDSKGRNMAKIEQHDTLCRIEWEDEGLTHERLFYQARGDFNDLARDVRDCKNDAEVGSFVTGSWMTDDAVCADAVDEAGNIIASERVFRGDHLVHVEYREEGGKQDPSWGVPAKQSFDEQDNLVAASSYPRCRGEEYKLSPQEVKEFASVGKRPYAARVPLNQLKPRSSAL
jgi:hypothetical protein